MVLDNTRERINSLLGREDSSSSSDIPLSAYEDCEIFERGEKIGEELQKQFELNTINTVAELDEDDDTETAFDEKDFFTDENGKRTITTKYDFEKQLDPMRKRHFQEIERYWVNEPYAFVSIFRSTKENEIKYYVIEPHLTELEEDLKDYISEKLRDHINYDEEVGVEDSDKGKADIIQEEALSLLEKYDLYTGDYGLQDSDEDEEDEAKSRVPDFISRWVDKFFSGDVADKYKEYLPGGDSEEEESGYSGVDISVRPDEAEVAEGLDNLSNYQVEKIMYYIRRDSVGFQNIDPIKHDINVEDISCDGYNSPVFVYHTEYEQIITNVYHGKESLDKFVVKLAQRSGKGISKRNPQVDVTLPDGSRGQLTLGSEVSDHGTNYTIRQFKEVPFTPIDLINWRTFSLDQMAFLWLCIQNHKSLIFAGGTASGKTTSLNAVSLFIPSSGKIVSIEDTREVELPQRNWIASVTRPSFTGDDKGDVDEFALLEAALRQRPDYIVMGEIRGEEGRTLFQVMSTGHTTYTTFHADSVGEVLKRFTTDPINVSKTMFTALDLVSIQSSTRVNGHKVRRNISLTEINHYDPENDEINVQDVYQWQAETDSFIQPGDSQIIEDIKFDRGWKDHELQERINERKVILAYLIKNRLNSYAQVAATFQAYMNDRQTILTLVAEDKLEESLDNLRQMESVLIDIDEEDEEQTPRPTPDEDMEELCDEILENNKDILEEYKGKAVSLENAVPSADDVGATEDIEVTDGEEGLSDGSSKPELFQNMVDKEEIIENEPEPEIEVIES